MGASRETSYSLVKITADEDRTSTTISLQISAPDRFVQILANGVGVIGIHGACPEGG